MLEMLKSVVHGTTSTEELRNKYFQDICKCEMEIEQINTKITELELERDIVEQSLNHAHNVYSMLSIKE